jgi:phosphopantetheine adenylyltransferase
LLKERNLESFFKQKYQRVTRYLQDAEEKSEKAIIGIGSKKGKSQNKDLNILPDETSKPVAKARNVVRLSQKLDP